MTGTGKLGYWKMAEDDYVEKILRILQAVSLFNVFKMSTGKCAYVLLSFTSAQRRRGQHWYTEGLSSVGLLLNYLRKKNVVTMEISS